MDELNTSLKDITIFGETNYRNTRKSFGIKRDDRRRHMYIIGKTGMGKTTLLENMIISDIIHGEGCCYIDPHGDTAEKILNFIPSNRINDVIYFNPADSDFPIAFNILEAVDENHKHLIASGIVGVFKKQFADSWGPRLEYILRNSILALLDYPGSTLLGIMRILVDSDYRGKVIEKIKDPVVKSFWVNEFSKWNDRVLQEVISPIQNKVGQFLSNFLIRNVVGQVKSTIDLREIMDKKKILILNLSKGRIGEDTMQLLGSMIVTKLYLAAMSRVDVLEKDRQDFYLYVDEFQNFATESFADILSEARKYRLNLIVAHQYIEQLPEEVSAAVFGNVGTLLCFRVGAADAEVLVKEFAPFFEEEDLVNLPAFSIYLKLMIDGITSDPFSSNTLPPLFEDLRTDSAEKVIKVSRERYANYRKVVEDKINRWSGMELSDKVVEAVTGERIYRPNNPPSADSQPDRRYVSDSPKSSQSFQSASSVPRQHNSPRVKSSNQDKEIKSVFESQKQKLNQKIREEQKKIKKEEKKFEIVCSECGQNSKIGFQPDGLRPVYCDDCMVKIKEERKKKKDLEGMKLKVFEELMREDEVKNPSISLADAFNKAQVKPRDVQEKKEKVPPVAPKQPLAINNFNQDFKDEAPKDEFDFKLEWYEEAKKKLGIDDNKKD